MEMEGGQPHKRVQARYVKLVVVRLIPSVRFYLTITVPLVEAHDTG